MAKNKTDHQKDLGDFHATILYIFFPAVNSPERIVRKWSILLRMWLWRSSVLKFFYVDFMLVKLPIFKSSKHFFFRTRHFFRVLQKQGSEIGIMCWWMVNVHLHAMRPYYYFIVILVSDFIGNSVVIFCSIEEIDIKILICNRKTFEN